MKVWLNVAPATMVGEKNRLFVEVTLCAMTSLLVHWTVVPTATLMESGRYAPVVWPDAPIGIDTGVGVVPPGVGVGVGAGVGEEEPPPHAAIATTHVRRLARQIFFMNCLFAPCFAVPAQPSTDRVLFQLLDRVLPVQRETIDERPAADSRQEVRQLGAPLLSPVRSVSWHAERSGKGPRRLTIPERTRRLA